MARFGTLATLDACDSTCNSTCVSSRVSGARGSKSAEDGSPSVKEPLPGLSSVRTCIVRSATEGAPTRAGRHGAAASSSRVTRASTQPARPPAPGQMKSASTLRLLPAERGTGMPSIVQRPAPPQRRAGPVACRLLPHQRPKAPQPDRGHRPYRRCDHGRCRL